MKLKTSTVRVAFPFHFIFCLLVLFILKLLAKLYTCTSFLRVHKITKWVDRYFRLGHDELAMYERKKEVKPLQVITIASIKFVTIKQVLF